MAKVKLGVFQNSKAVLVELSVTNEDLRLSQGLNGDPLVLKDKDGKETFRIEASPKTVLTDNYASFPIPKNKQNTKVIFTIEGEGMELKFHAATAKNNFVAVEKQVTKAVKTMQEIADTIEEV